MDPSTDIVIVSAFGRGHWICRELLGQNYKVGLVDVSSRLGRWAPEDWEGPFPCFETSQLYPSQRARLVEDEETIGLQRGFTLWLKEGPLELKSPLTTFLMGERSISRPVEEYLMGIPSESHESTARRNQALKGLSFRGNWLAQFAHQWSSTRYQPNHLGIHSGKALSLFTPCFMRRASRFSFDKSLQDFKRLGGEVVLGSELRDILLAGKKISAVEVGSERSGHVLNGTLYLWMLTSQETYFLSEKIGQSLFPKGAVEPMWVWVRYRVELVEGMEKKALPDHFVIIDHLDLPWTRENFLTCIRAPNPSQLDVWMRIPQQQRFQRRDLEEMAEATIERLKARMPSSDPTLLEMPQEYLYDYRELGPSRHLVYKQESFEESGVALPENLLMSSPETWDRLDWNCQLESQQELYKSILSYIHTKKGDTSDTALHP